MERTYTTRDNATRALRKLGVTKEEYAKFLRKLDDGKFVVTRDEPSTQESVAPEPERPVVPFTAGDVVALSTRPKRAESRDAKAKKAAKAKVVKAAKVARAKVVKAAKVARAKVEKTEHARKNVPTVASEARRLILEGFDNAAVFKKLQTKFGVGDEKRGYPAWYRCELRRKGLVK